MSRRSVRLLVEDMLEAVERIIGLRNRVVHGYFAVDLELVWRIVVSDLPILTSRLRALRGSLP
jgi:uncharacterized protein with HEPN domain